MGLETAVNIADLVKTNPGANDPKSQGDDHLRNTKTAVLNAFAGFLGSVMVTGVDAGVTNAYTLTPSTPLPAYAPRLIAVFSPIATNTGPATLNISGKGVKPILRVDGSALAAGDLVVGRLYSAIYNGTAFQLETVTQNYIDQLIISASIPGVNNPANAGKYFTTDGVSGGWNALQLDLRGAPTGNKGNSGTAAQVFNYTDGEGQSITNTGAFSFSAAGFPAGKLAGILVRVTNGGANPMSSTGITWFKGDGTTAATFETSGIVLPAAGIGQLVIYSYGDGTIYGKAA